MNSSFATSTARRRDLPSLSAAHLWRLGVRKLNRYGLILECTACGTSWSSKAGADGKLPPAYWHCPNRCNW